MHHLLDTGLISISVEYLHFGGNKAEGRRQEELRETDLLLVYGFFLGASHFGKNITQ